MLVVYLISALEACVIVLELTPNKRVRLEYKSQTLVSASEGTSESFQDDLRQRSTFYFVDGIDIPDRSIKAKCLLVSSPKRDRYREYDKRPGVIHLLMHPWSLEELLAAQACLSPLVPTMLQEFQAAKAKALPTILTDADIVVQRWTFLGGTFRFVLVKLDIDAKIKMDQAIKQSLPHLATVLSSSGEAVGEAEASSLVVHQFHRYPLSPDRHFNGVDLDFASTYARKEARKSLLAQNRDSILKMVHSVEARQFYSSGLMHLFEDEAHAQLVHGGRFFVRPLVKGTETKKRKKMETLDIQQLILPSLNLKHIDTDASIEALTPDDYGKPQRKNFESVDSLRRPDQLFQITGGKTHAIKEHGVLKLHHLLKQDQYSFYFVLPSARFDAFNLQSFVDESDQVIDESKSQVKSLVTQYALLIDTDPSSQYTKDLEKKVFVCDVLLLVEL